MDNMKEHMEDCATQISTPDHPVTPYFIRVSFEDVPRPQLKLFLNKMPASFSLRDAQVDALISSVRSLLRAHPEFQQPLTDLAQS